MDSRLKFAPATRFPARFFLFSFKLKLIYYTLYYIYYIIITGMTLNAAPYFNEAGYEKQVGTPEGEINAKSYNELTSVRLCDHVISGIKYVYFK